MVATLKDIKEEWKTKKWAENCAEWQNNAAVSFDCVPRGGTDMKSIHRSNLGSCNNLI